MSKSPSRYAALTPSLPISLSTYVLTLLLLLTSLLSLRFAGERFAAIGDWTNACIALRKSLEALETLCGRGDRRTIEVAKLLSAALENRLRVNQIRIGEEEAAIAITDGINTANEASINGEKLQT